MMIEHEVEAIWKRAAVLARPEVHTLLLTGPDRVRFLNGMISNDVAKLAPGGGMAAIKTSNRGRVEGVLRVRATADAIAIELLDVVAEKVRATLDQYIIMDDCAIRDVSGEREVVSVFGPDAAKVIAAAGIATPAQDDHAFIVQDGVTIIRDVMFGVRGYELHVAAAQPMIDRLIAHGAVHVSREALDVARIEAGVPIDGRDLDEDTIPMEARLEHALSFDKGCYIGQEVIARATNLGGVKHILVGLELAGDVVPDAGGEGVALLAGDARTGEITSVARSPSLGKVIALGFVRRAHEAAGTALIADAAGQKIGAKVVELPFIRG
jgi:folate-binding protein YgfZ